MQSYWFLFSSPFLFYHLLLPSLLFFSFTRCLLNFSPFQLSRLSCCLHFSAITRRVRKILTNWKTKNCINVFLLACLNDHLSLFLTSIALLSSRCIFFFLAFATTWIDCEWWDVSLSSFSPPLFLAVWVSYCAHSLSHCLSLLGIQIDFVRSRHGQRQSLARHIVSEYHLLSLKIAYLMWPVILILLHWDIKMSIKYTLSLSCLHLFHHPHHQIYR